MTHTEQDRKNILMIAYTYYEVDPRVIREAEAAVAGGFEVDFLALSKPGQTSTEVVRGVRLVRLNQAKYRGRSHWKYFVEYLKFFLRCFVKATALFAQRRYAVIHVNNMPDFLVFCTLIPKMFGAKIILDIHDPMPDTFISKFQDNARGFYYRLLLWQERLSVAYSDRLITVHDPVKNGILVKHGIPPESIEVIANFADQDLFPLRRSFSVDGPIRFLFHGTILERSGLRILMNALDKVRHKDRISVKIIGEGDFSSELTRLIRSLKLEDVVEFDNHIYPVHSLAEHIVDCNVGLVPFEVSAATMYALPLKLLEYLSMGLPVLTVRAYAVSYYFTDEDCMFFEANDPSSLGAMIDRIAENPNMLKHYRERSIALRPEFSWTGEQRKYVALLNRLSGIPEAVTLSA